MLLCAVLAPCALRLGQAWVLPETRHVRRPPVRPKYTFGSSHRPATVVVHSAGETKDSGGKSSEAADKSADTRFTIGKFGVLLLMGFEMLAAAKQGGLSMPAGRAHFESLGMFAVTAAALRVMRKAASRSRLNGGTFRVIGLGCLCAFTGIFCHVGFIMAAYLTKSFAHRSTDMASAYLMASLQVKSLPWWFNHGPTLWLGGIALFTCVPIISTTYAALQRHGLPKFKLEMPSDDAEVSYLCLAIGYAVSSLHQVINGAHAILHSGFKTQGLLQCFIVGACFHVCQSAAFVGPKRLRSATYRTLNAALAFHSILRLVSQSRHGSVLLPWIALLSSGTGWLVGTFSK